MKIKEKFQNLKLATRIALTMLSIFIPISMLLTAWFLYTVYYNHKYDQLAENATILSEFSLDFKDNFDYEIYLMIVGSLRLSQTKAIPYIEEAEKVLSSIDLSQEAAENIEQIKQNRKYLEKLREYTGVLDDKIVKGTGYDEKMRIWENDVMVVTTLIQENILNILHNETKIIADVRRQMEKARGQILFLSGGLLVFALLLITLTTIMVSRTVTKPILYLQNLTQRVAGGDLTVRSELTTGAEVKKLSDSLNLMIGQISSLIERNRLKQIRLREAELEVLQTQINPHFLYNTLDTIVWLAEAGKQKEVVQIVENLSSFFRVTLNKGDDMALVEQECIHVESYLKIQQIRYQDILSYEIEIPQELKQYRIPKITLQPLVENALYHGIKNKRGQGSIKIGGREEEERFLLWVSDNGIGMKEERLSEIREALKPEARRRKDSYGLYNVNERLRLKFGAESYLDIESEYGRGTTVKVCLPKTVSGEISEYEAGRVLREELNQK